MLTGSLNSKINNLHTDDGKHRERERPSIATMVWELHKDGTAFRAVYVVNHNPEVHDVTCLPQAATEGNTCTENKGKPK